MAGGWRGTLVATALVSALAAFAFGHVTRGFRVVTSDGARQYDLARAPVALPDMELADASGRRFHLRELGNPQRQTLVTFLYTHCLTVCRSSASGQAYLQAELIARGLSGRYQLLAISFDPDRDTLDVLRAYGRKQGADPAVWRMATVADAADLPALLKTFGIVVLPDGRGDYVHNAAHFLIDGQGRLARAYDIDRPDAVLADIVHAQR
ncbi:hypothetical protein LMG23992_01707 [Cupriavidus laharis]|uniref:Thioredoxin domain-containing protein n=1 Tax=Cupriavidus laharis TaxID=151654 RepID=A0ABM8WT62_9BURK|nr:SCO family protein [Cupriavidus laharis]CAG9170665.1 hypothetical protein LMG23992_01707 [Cupriavidus laharis]